MAKIISLILVLTSSQASISTLSIEDQCESVVSYIYDGARDGADNYTETQFCEAYADDSNCILALKLKCELEK